MITKVPFKGRSNMSLLRLACCLAWLSLPILFIQVKEVAVDIILAIVLMGAHFLAKGLDMLWIEFLTAITFFPEFIFPVFWYKIWIIYM